jgi:hypothetical protein
LALEDTTERLARENDAITGSVTLSGAKHILSVATTGIGPLIPTGQTNLDISLTISKTDSEPTPQDGDA